MNKYKSSVFETAWKNFSQNDKNVFSYFISLTEKKEFPPKKIIIKIIFFKTNMFVLCRSDKTQELKQWDVTLMERISTFSRRVWNSVATKKNQGNKKVFQSWNHVRKIHVWSKVNKIKHSQEEKNQTWNVETLFCNPHSERPVVTRGFFWRSLDFSVMAGNKITSWSFNI